MATPAASTSIFRRVFEPDVGSTSADLARCVLSLDFRGEDHEWFEHLSGRVQEGALTPAEADELGAYLPVDSLLSIPRLKAQRSLRQSA